MSRQMAVIWNWNGIGIVQECYMCYFTNDHTSDNGIKDIACDKKIDSI